MRGGLADRLALPLIGPIAPNLALLPMQQIGNMCLSATEAADVHTECTMPSLLSTPMCAFSPKYHCWPFLVWCIAGSRSPVEFLLDEGAWIMVASTMVPVVI